MNQKRERLGAELDDLVRVSRAAREIPNFPWTVQSVYRWYQAGKHPELFAKVAGTLFLRASTLRKLIAGQ
jgi:hypothetical protein